MACPQYTEKELTDAAQKVFGYLKEQWQGSFSIYWQLGHSFDTIIDYFALNPADADGFGQIALDAHTRSTGNACWYDDFGWWGIAALKASQHPELFPDKRSVFRTISEGCWNMMDEHAPNVWKNNGNIPVFQVLHPRFTGGVWNCDWTYPNGCCAPGQSPRLPTCCSVDNTQGNNLGGIQNTVTNGLYLVLASRLGQSGPARREYEFLSKWFNIDETVEPGNALLNHFVGGALVRERVSTYASQNNGPYPCVCGYQSELAWAGDQGIILGGLVDRMNMVGHDSPDYRVLRQHAEDIAAGVLSKTNSNRSNPRILQAWVTGQGGDPGDYNTGIGVYMRYLLYAYQNNSDMRTYLGNPDYVDFVCNNAAYVMSKIDGDQWSLVELTNDLATLVAAIVMSRT